MATCIRCNTDIGCSCNLNEKGLCSNCIDSKNYTKEKQSITKLVKRKLGYINKFVSLIILYL